MELTNAISVHQQWKKRLKGYLAGSNPETFEPGLVGKEDQCELGKWIQGPGLALHASLLEFRELKDCHADFHRSAAQVVRTFQGGDAANARVLLDGEFADCSSEVTMAITRLRAVTASQPNHGAWA